MPITLATAVGPSWPIAIGANFNTFTTRQDVSPRGAGIGELPTIQGGSPFYGMKIKVEADGEFSTTGTPTLSIGCYIGTAAGAITTVLAENTAITTGSGAASWPWRLNWCGIFVQTGTSGSVVGSGTLDYGTSLTAYTTVPIPSTLALRTIVWDTTIARSIGICATWGTNSVSNNIRVYNHSVLTLNGP
jgi:hypothetical protein